MAETKGSYYYQSADVESNLHEKADMEHGAINLAVNPNYYEIQRANTFEFCVYDLNGITPVTGSQNKYAAANAEEVIRLSVIESSVPHFSQEAIELKRGNSTIKFADAPKFDAGSIKCNDFIGAGTLEALMNWQNKSYDINTEKVGLAQDYKKECTLTEYTPTFQPVRMWRMYGCWISKISEDTFTYENSGKRSISVDIQYDYAKLEEL